MAPVDLGNVLVILLILSVPLLAVYGLYLARQAYLRFQESVKTCPDCVTRVPANARVCRYCGYRFDS
jgi:Uncharacterised protein family UPF0547